MSDMERNKGKLFPCEIGDIESKFPDADFDDFDDLEYDTNDEFICINTSLFRVEWEVKKDSEVPEFAEVNTNEDGSINFHTYHYNGGGHWTEIVESGLDYSIQQ